MAVPKKAHERFPHISFREVPAEQEAYLPGTGLTVWEVAWIAEAYDGDVEATAEHLTIEPALVREALDYAAEHTEEIGMQIHDHVCWEPEDFRRAFPRARIITFDPETGELCTPPIGLDRLLARRAHTARSDGCLSASGAGRAAIRGGPCVA